MKRCLATVSRHADCDGHLLQCPEVKSGSTACAENLPGPPVMVPAGTMVLSQDAQALKLEQGILGPASPIPSPCLLLKNMFNPSE